MIDQPISALAVRFGRDLYRPEEEDLPDSVVRQVVGLSRDLPGVRFLLLRTECSGGDCMNWGIVILNGLPVLRAEGQYALRRLTGYFGVDIGEREAFDPLRRDFQWEP